MTSDHGHAVNGSIVRSGIEGLDAVLRGGLTPNRLYLVEGDPGSGKTTLALQFLLEGVRSGETCLFVSLSESEEELGATAASHGWDLDGLHILEIVASEANLLPDSRYTMYHPSEVELSETTKSVLAEAARLKPSRIIFDSLSELRLLAEHPLRYRRQILALKQHFSRHGATVFFIDDKTSDDRDLQLHSLAHGVLSLERFTPEYGSSRRRLQITKMRGRAFSEGRHDYVIQRGGLLVFPRLVASEHRVPYDRKAVSSGLKALDDLLGGGLAKGTSTLVIGAAGTGKSSLSTQYACAAAARGERVSLFLFDESVATYLERSNGLGMSLAPMVHAGQIHMRQIDPAEMSPGEFTHEVRRSVQEQGTSMVVIDTLNGYLNAMPSERFLTLHLHEMLTFLAQQGVTTLMLMTQHGFLGNTQVPIDASYLADTVLLLRYYEAVGEVRQAISVIKKRTGKHERSIRELRLDDGFVVGDVIRGFRGVLSGVPEIIHPVATDLPQSV